MFINGQKFIPIFLMHTTLNYSPNFDIKKRKSHEIKFIIFHYTGMKNEKKAIYRLTSLKSKVSSHYFIKKNGEILTLVPDLYIAWHAGTSNWRNLKSLNKHSIGIEISNPGHKFSYKKFSQNQIKSVLKLSKFLIKKYKIKSEFILGHSDISPERKKDPGEKFPWEFLAKNKVGIWHKLNQSNLLSERNKKINKIDKKIFVNNLYKIGYTKNLNNNLEIVVKAFQRRFRQQLINGLIDRECVLIGKNLVETNLNNS